MLITRITKKNDTSVIVWLDNGQKLYISYEVLIKNGLRKNSEVSESHFDFLVKENQKYYIKQSAYNILSRRLHSIRELQNKLSRKQYDPQLVNDTIEYLISVKLLDDHKFASEFIDEKIKYSAWGKSKLKGELIKRGISQDIISDLLGEMLSDDVQLNAAVQAANKKANMLKGRNIDNKKLLQKIYTYLQSKGFSYDISKRAVEEIFKISLEEDQ